MTVKQVCTVSRCIILYDSQNLDSESRPQTIQIKAKTGARIRQIKRLGPREDIREGRPWRNSPKLISLQHETFNVQQYRARPSMFSFYL